MVMEKFEKQFEDLDVQIETMEGAMQNTTTLTTPQDQVDSLIKQVADEHGLFLFFSFLFFFFFFLFNLFSFSFPTIGLEVDLSMGNVPQGSVSSAEREQDELSQRLAKLRNMDN